MTEDKNSFQGRIDILQDFKKSIIKWSNNNQADEEKTNLRSYINRNLIAVKSIINEAGAARRLFLSPPAMIGGPIAKNIDPLDMIFEDWYGDTFISVIVDIIDQSIGVYEHWKNNTGLIKKFTQEAIDIESAIIRSLRPSFRNSQPSSEIEVQDAVENILNSIGIIFTREKENVSVGPRAFHPDFIVDDLELVIEIKLATPKHGASNIQEEITSDISAYRTKWKHLMFVVYDNGVIVDPHKFRIDNMRLFGVEIVIVKH
jgi:hypothetical protein